MAFEDSFAMFPTEKELAEHFQISRSTVRQAFRELTDEGSIIRHKGKGTMTAPKKYRQDFLYVLESFNDEMLQKGLKPFTKVLDLSLHEASQQVAAGLNIVPGSSVIRLVRTRGVDKHPMVIVTTYLPNTYGLEALLHEDFENNSLYKILEDKYRLPIDKSKRFLEVRLADGCEAEQLGIPFESPIQYIETIAYSLNDAPVEFSCASYRGDLSCFRIEIKKQVHNSTG